MPIDTGRWRYEILLSLSHSEPKAKGTSVVPSVSQNLTDQRAVPQNERLFQATHICSSSLTTPLGEDKL
ncbi:Protein of unknown function [Pyronema omphalodes CBS 100304]|uniref:Uncharacterized protein n=1 Tax=Pyronema omphalodes (strain CBS 100304) TaxID=1076935 RepID=U4LDU6_PYROM|nr:Protein of unknown function [Pyronema omphalodes CBS 100304]